jgi:hypothetical protein
MKDNYNDKEIEKKIENNDQEAIVTKRKKIKKKKKKKKKTGIEVTEVINKKTDKKNIKNKIRINTEKEMINILEKSVEIEMKKTETVIRKNKRKNIKNKGLNLNKDQDLDRK